MNSTDDSTMAGWPNATKAVPKSELAGDFVPSPTQSIAVPNQPTSTTAAPGNTVVMPTLPSAWMANAGRTSSGHAQTRQPPLEHASLADQPVAAPAGSSATKASDDIDEGDIYVSPEVLQAYKAMKRPTNPVDLPIWLIVQRIIAKYEGKELSRQQAAGISSGQKE